MIAAQGLFVSSIGSTIRYLAACTCDQSRESADVDTLLNEMNRAVAEQEVGATRMERVDIAVPVDSEIRIGVGRFNFSVSAVEGARARRADAVRCESVECDVRSRTGPGTAICVRGI